ncbi:MAG: 5-formyltetrahydrofolate cyclo-ligase [Magnetococcales bacterium]|nr:5-formyltetrahydrofolate cyclo-ligase [Magnetococcales bacterium]
MNIPAEKGLLRKRLREQRKRLTPAEAASLSGAICAHAMALPAYHAAPIVGLYLPVDQEVDTALLVADAHQRGKIVLLPVVSRSERRMAFLPHRPNDPLRPGAFGIPEPLDDGTPAPLPDLLFVPLVGFDERGVRLGYGGGYYDRWLAAWEPGDPLPSPLLPEKPRPLLVGLAYALQQIPRSPRESHDHLLDGVVTEHGVIWTRGDSSAPGGESDAP